MYLRETLARYLFAPSFFVLKKNKINILYSSSIHSSVDTSKKYLFNTDTLNGEAHFQMTPVSAGHSLNIVFEKEKTINSTVYR